MKIFLDTANLEAISKINETGLLNGVTTNPTKILATGKPFMEVISEICSIVKGPVCAEVVADFADDIVQESEKVASLAPNVAIKVPMTTEGMKACRRLRDKNIMVNVTMVFSPDQAMMAMKAGASFVSIILSRLDSIGGNIEDLIRDTVTIKNNYRYETEILAASIKTRRDVINCMKSAVDIISIPDKLFFDLFTHPLTDKGLNEFEEDWKRMETAGLI